MSRGYWLYTAGLDHQMGEIATYPIVWFLDRLGYVAHRCREWPCASSRLASQSKNHTLEHVQLRNLGLSEQYQSCIEKERQKHRCLLKGLGLQVLALRLESTLLHRFNAKDAFLTPTDILRTALGVWRHQQLTRHRLIIKGPRYHKESTLGWFVYWKVLLLPVSRSE